jgi:endonuclease/exonuclease/phosphatase (EEP) superfamily protein YafD
MSLAPLVFAAILGPLVLVGAIACALAAGLAQLGRRSLAWDVLSHAAPLYLGGGLAAIAAALLFHDDFRILGLVAGLVAVAAAAALMVPEYLRAAAPPVPTGPLRTLKVVQLNIWGGQGGMDRAIAWLAAEKPDIVVVQETNRAVREALARGTGLNLTVGRSNVVILSREPPTTPILPSNETDGPMMMIGAVFADTTGPFTVLGVHYNWPTEFERLAQAAPLIGVVRRHPAETTILAGDFNSTPWSFTRRREDREFGLIRRTRGLYSWPASRHLPFPILPIDHVYAGAGWATVKVERGPNLGSDHYPVVVTLARIPTP